MLYYLAGSLEPKIFERTADRAFLSDATGLLRANHFLFSFANKLARECAHYFCLQPQRRIFVDSGAYTVWKRREEIKLADYIAFCKVIRQKAKCKDLVFAALDVIPGKPGKAPTETEKEEACQKGWDNYKTMKQEGIPCLMTFHQLEHWRQLRRIMDDCDHFAVSIRKDRTISDEAKLKWLKDVFRECGYSEDTPVTKWKIHGLGVSSVDWMEQVPFFSVDNTDAINAGRRYQLHLFSGKRRVKATTRADWELRASEDGIPLRHVGRMLGFDPDGESKSHGLSGSYWLQTQAMKCCVETEYHITKLWRSRAIDWPEQKDIAPTAEPAGHTGEYYKKHKAEIDALLKPAKS